MIGCYIIGTSPEKMCDVPIYWKSFSPLLLVVTSLSALLFGYMFPALGIDCM